MKPTVLNHMFWNRQEGQECIRKSQPESRGRMHAKLLQLWNGDRRRHFAVVHAHSDGTRSPSSRISLAGSSHQEVWILAPLSI